jgi:hypothetical protein
MSSNRHCHYNRPLKAAARKGSVSMPSAFRALNKRGVSAPQAESSHSAKTLTGYVRNIDYPQPGDAQPRSRAKGCASAFWEAQLLRANIFCYVRISSLGYSLTHSSPLWPSNIQCQLLLARKSFHQTEFSLARDQQGLMKHTRQRPRAMRHPGCAGRNRPCHWRKMANVVAW